MRIVHILVGKANPETMNGVNKVVHHLATEQTKLDFDVEVWGITATPNVVHHNHCYSLRLFHKSAKRFSLGEDLKYSLQNLSRSSIIHLHSVFIPEFYAITRLLIRKHVPWVLSPHSGYSHYSMRRNCAIKKFYFALFDRYVVHGARALHAIGESELHDLSKLAPRSQIVVIPNGQPTEDLGHSRSIENREGLTFGFCGRLDMEQKGLDLLIRGFAHYRHHGGVGTLRIVGDGKDRRALERLAVDLVPTGSIAFTGPKFGKEKLESLNEMDVFLHPSRWEGMPMAVLEAAALGLPLIVSRETNMAAAVDRHGCGVVLEKNTPANIAEALHRMECSWRSGGFQSIAVGSRNMIAREHNWQVIAKRFVEAVYA